MNNARPGSNVQARLAFPELVLEVDVRSARAFGSDIEALRDGVVGAIDIPTCEEQCTVTLLLSGVREGDFYTRSSRRSRHLRVLLSPEAVESLLYKLNEITTAGGPSTPEFGEFDEVNEMKIERPVLRKARTLSVYLSAK